MTNETLWVNFKHCAYESCFISRIAKIWNLFILYCGCSFKSNCGNVGLIALQRFYHLTELVIYKSHSWDILRNDLASKWHMLCKVFPKKVSKGHNCFVTDDSIVDKVKRFFVVKKYVHLGLNCLHAWFTIDTFTKPFANYSRCYMNEFG